MNIYKFICFWKGCDNRMAQRTVALCDGKYIGIEPIYTVINGRQINIPEKLKELRAKKQIEYKASFIMNAISQLMVPVTINYYS